ncbi:FACT complex subunit [Puccinia graminis f. sp. tritici]|uniref:FACT complex subunit POB3 n=1 Tax=Puccinia graminis f. sp. tritici TaxID=56615 RepID=A0A5B0MM56_PUCGR|nr:FACT complex subunit [Puccinia graminis f. sp. tritici]
MTAAVADFDHIYRGLQPSIGKLRIAASGLGWKPSDSPNIVTVAKDDIKWVQWIKVARGYQLRIGLNKDRSDIKIGDRRRESFDGFRPEDQEKLSNLFKQHFHVTLETKDLSLRGWNWGKMDVQASDLAFLVAGKLAFEVPLGLVHNSSISKTEVAVEFLDQANQPKLDGLSGISRVNAKKSTTDQLVEMRLYVPGNASTNVNEGNSEADDPADGELSAAQALHDLIMEKAEIGRVQGEGIVTFPDVLCTTPRGRYDLDMHADFLRLRGKTYDYKVLYSSIQKLFLLPKPDDIHFLFVVQLDPPIRQGQTRYPFLVMQFAKDEEIDAEMNLDEDTLNSTFQQTDNKIEGQAHEVVSIVFKGLAKKKIIFPQNFSSANGQSAIKCNMKANEGLLYFLDKYVLCISKQSILINLADLHSVKFARVGGALQSGRTFDLVMTKKDEVDLQFSSLSREEHPVIESYFETKGKKIENEMNEDILSNAVAALSDDDDLDDDDDDDDDDEGGGRRDRKSKSKPKPSAAANADDDDDESDDESFHGGSDDSDVAEEFDSNYGGSDSDDSDSDDENADPAPPQPSKKNKASASTSELPPSKKQKKA